MVFNKYNKPMIKQCFYCKRIFVTPTVRRKYYCSKQCLKNKLSDYHKLWRAKNPERTHLNKINYYNTHQEQIKEYGRQYNLKNRSKINEYSKNRFKERRQKDMDFRVKGRLRCLLRNNISRYSKGGKIQSASKYGINYKEIIEHLKPFPKDIQNYHIDHIRPISSFNMNSLENIKKAFAPENHQWLPAKDNMRKSGANRRDFKIS